VSWLASRTLFSPTHHPPRTPCLLQTSWTSSGSWLPHFEVHCDLFDLPPHTHTLGLSPVPTDFFQADGEGLPAKSLEKDVQRNLLLLQLYHQPTDGIVSLLNQDDDSVIKDFILRILKLRAILLDDAVAKVITQDPDPQPVRTRYMCCSTSCDLTTRLVPQIKNPAPVVEVAGQAHGLRLAAIFSKFK